MLFYLPLFSGLSSLVNIHSFSHTMPSVKGIKRVTAVKPWDSGEGEWNWTLTYAIDIAAGEDIKEEIMSFAEDHQMIIIDLSHGSVSSASIKPLSSAESLIYEGELPITGLRGTYVRNTYGPATGGLVVKLIGTDGQIVRGHVEDFLIAATAVRVLAYIYEFSEYPCSTLEDI